MFEKSHRKNQIPLQIVYEECCWSELIFTFLYVDIHVSFVNFDLHPNLQKNSNELEKKETRKVRAKFKRLYLGNSSKSGTFLYEVHYSQWPILLPPKVLTFTRESPCILNYILRQIQTTLSW
jgi:hypothetical protein